MSDIFLTNIQRFSLHDGPGIRTTAFLKGCSLRCPWCSNPENLVSTKQKYIKDGREGVYGKWYKSDELFQELIKDKMFYGNVDTSAFDNITTTNILTNPSLFDKLPGGITFSGGECLLQMDRLVEVLEKLKNESIHITVETCLFVPTSQLSIALNYIDLFYVDIKLLDKQKCRTILHGELSLYLQNFDILMNSKKLVVARVPVIAGFTDEKDNRQAIEKLLKKYKEKIIKVELIKEHNLGANKYKSLIDGGNEIVIPNYNGVSNELMEIYKNNIVDKTGLWTEICKI